MPIRNADDEVVAVAQVINKAGAQEGFSKEDEKVVNTCIPHTHAHTYMFKWRLLGVLSYKDYFL